MARSWRLLAGKLGPRSSDDWNLRTGERGAYIDSYDAHRGETHALAVGQLADRTVIVSGGGTSGGKEGAVRVWDVASGQFIGTPSLGPYGAIQAVVVGELEKQSMIAAGSEDGSLYLWYASGTPRFVASTDMNISALDLKAPSTLVVGGSLGVMCLDLG